MNNRLPAKSWAMSVKPVMFPARSRKTGDQSVANRIITRIPHHDRYGTGGLLGGSGRCYPDGNNAIDLETYQFGRKLGVPIEISVCEAPLNDKVLSLNVPKPTQGLLEHFFGGTDPGSM